MRSVLAMAMVIGLMGPESGGAQAPKDTAKPSAKEIVQKIPAAKGEGKLYVQAFDAFLEGAEAEAVLATWTKFAGTQQAYNANMSEAAKKADDEARQKRKLAVDSWTQGFSIYRGLTKEAPREALQEINRRLVKHLDTEQGEAERQPSQRKNVEEWARVQAFWSKEAQLMALEREVAERLQQPAPTRVATRRPKK